VVKQSYQAWKVDSTVSHVSFDHLMDGNMTVTRGNAGAETQDDKASTRMYFYFKGTTFFFAQHFFY
jgi:hypothetical protein